MEELKDAGMLLESESAGYLAVAEEHESFHHVMKALERYPMFDGSSLAALCGYLGDHYSSRERSLLNESLALLPNDLPRVAGLISSVEWLEAISPGRNPPAMRRAWRPRARCFVFSWSRETAWP